MHKSKQTNKTGNMLLKTEPAYVGYLLLQVTTPNPHTRFLYGKKINSPRRSNCSEDDGGIVARNIDLRRM